MNWQYGVNYNRGDVFFTRTPGSFVSDGIVVRTAPECKSRIEVSHCGIVANATEGWESTTPRVRLGKIPFDDPKTEVYIRHFRGWSPEFAEELIAEAASHEGELYDTTLLVAHGISSLLPIRALNAITGHYPERWLGALFSSRRKKICSRFVAHCTLAVRPEWKWLHRTCLRIGENTITPQELFEDLALFNPFAYSTDLTALTAHSTG